MSLVSFAVLAVLGLTVVALGLLFWSPADAPDPGSAADDAAPPSPPAEGDDAPATAVADGAAPGEPVAEEDAPPEPVDAERRLPPARAEE